jgi:hypothetical protein
MKLRIELIIVLVFGLAACTLPEELENAAATSLAETPTVPGAGATIPPGLMVSVSEASECLSGPGPTYDPVGTLSPGQETEAVSRSEDGEYWLIRDPANPTTLCWAESVYFTIKGDPFELPIATPPPTPTPVGPTPVNSPTPVGPTPVSSPTPVGPTPVSSPTPVGPTPVSSPTPVGPTPVSSPTPVGAPAAFPTPVSSPTSVGAPAAFPTPVNSPTPVDPPSVKPTKVNSPTPVKPTKVP